MLIFHLRFDPLVVEYLNIMDFWSGNFFSRANAKILWNDMKKRASIELERDIQIGFFFIITCSLSLSFISIFDLLFVLALIQVAQQDFTSNQPKTSFTSGVFRFSSFLKNDREHFFKFIL